MTRTDSMTLNPQEYSRCKRPCFAIERLSKSWLINSSMCMHGQGLPRVCTSSFREQPEFSFAMDIGTQRDMAACILPRSQSRCHCAFQASLPRRKLKQQGARQRRERGDVYVAHAKKKKGKGGQKKGPGSLMDIPEVEEPAAEAALEPWEETDVIMGNLLLIESFYRNVGRPLLEDVELTDIAQELWEAPFGLLAHDIPEKEGEAVFSYANKAALGLFEAEWDELIGKPSSISAEPDAQEERSQALSTALKSGKNEGITGWRRSLKGKRFQIVDATLFNICSPTGAVLGQGVKIGQWVFEDGTRAGPEAPVDPDNIPQSSDIAAAESAVQQQASEVRALKEGQGLPNDDPAVQAAVAELLQRKSKLQKIQDSLAKATGDLTAEAA